MPSNHAFHETLEITQGFTPWFETGFYVFSSIQPGEGWEWVGDHLRPRVRVPEEWHWPVGLSLSTVDNAHEQQHQLFPTLDLNFSPEWEFNFGDGFGLTRRTDDLMVKLIVGRRF